MAIEREDEPVVPAPRPAGTRIQLEATATTFALEVPPPRGFQKPIKFAFYVVWFAGLGYISSRGDAVYFMLVLAWAFSVVMAWRSLVPLFQTVRLDLDGTAGGSLRRSPFGRTHRLDPARLRVRIGQPPRLQQPDPSEATKVADVVLLYDGERHHALLNGFGGEEQRWVSGQLFAWLEQRHAAGNVQA
jgi:hypothetical protein